MSSASSQLLETRQADLEPAASAFHTAEARLPASPAELPEPAGQFVLRDYWRIAYARRRVVLWTVAFALLAAGIYNHLRVPTYRATVTIQVNREEPHIARFDEQRGRLPEQPDYLETQYRVLQSRRLAGRIIAKLGLQDRAEFRREVSSRPAGEQDISAPAGIPAAAVDAFLDRLDVDPAKGTRLVQVSFETVDRVLAPKVVNALAEEYIEHNLEAEWSRIEKASAWLERQLAALREQLEAGESELQEYAAGNSILFVEERKDLTTEKLAQLEDELTRAQAARIQQESLAMGIRQARKEGLPPPPLLTSETYLELQAKLGELRRELSQLRVTHGDRNPEVIRLQSQAAELEKSIAEEEQRVLHGAEEGLQFARRRETLLQSAVERQRDLVNQLSNKFIQYNILKGDAETSRQLYEGLLERLKQAGVSAGLQASNIAILDRAEPPREAYRPKKLLNLLLALAAGLALGLAAAFLQEHFDTLVRTPEEVEQITQLRFLGIIPRSRRLTGRVMTEAQRSRRSAGASNGSNGGRRLIQLSAARDAGRQSEQILTEAYRALRSSLLLGRPENMRRILITSCHPEEGKTTVSVNLAASLAQLGRRALLIDGDMRRPVCHQRLGIAAEKGLSDYLQGRADLEEILVATHVAELSLVAGGRPTALASNLVHSPRFDALFSETAERYDHILVDSPPSLALPDARTISQWVDGVILVVSDRTDRTSLLRTKKMFDEAGVRFLGFVMNRVDLDDPRYGHYGGYGDYAANFAEQGRGVES